MKTFILCLSLLAAPTMASEAGVPDAGPVITVTEIVIVGSADAGVSVSIDAGVNVVTTTVTVVPSLDSPLSSAKGFYQAIRTGNGWMAAMFLLFFVVGLIRVVGKRIHDMISDTVTNPVLKLLQKFLRFIFDTKIGGWLLNWMSAVGGCLTTAAVAGAPVDAASWKIAVMASTGGTALIELKDDVLEWWDARTARIKAELAAKLAEAEKAAAAAASSTPTPPMTPAATTPPAVPPVTPNEPPKAS